MKGGAIMPRHIKDISGMKFNKLTAVEIFSKSDQGKNGTGQQTKWKCICECGNECIVATGALIFGSYKSCGCEKKVGKMGSANFKWAGGRTTTNNGYVIIRVYDYPGSTKSLSIHEHVYIMAKHLGRALVKGETVHHKNGVRDDNRLENLELWSSAQPPGQRVEDKIEWAKQILKLYENWNK
jgi:hypothetical protein